MRVAAGVVSSDYQVALPVFEGPLDLLLHLIERQELDITEVSLAQVTNQYLDYLARISERNPEDLADFLVVAAKLLLIKSRVLLPQPPTPALSDDEEAGDDLVRQLIEYKRFKEIAGWLRVVEEQGQQAYVRLPGIPPVERVVDLGDVSLDDLLEAVRQALEVKPPQPTVDRDVPPINISIADQMALIERRTAEGRRASFRRLLEDARNRIEIIVTLLALLEMVKQLRVRMCQDRLFGDILIERRTVSA
ncbi:MAG: segregation/condensation protein A [Anaerolineae bacterium]|jgi:segregation and condensation protein A